MQCPRLDEAAEQQRGVDRDHYRIVLVAKLLAALGKSPLRITFGHDQLRQPFDGYREDQQVIHRRIGPYQLSRTNSAEKPGPIAIISPIEPGDGGSAMVA